MWICLKCGEQLDDQFDSCWRCASPPQPIAPPEVFPLKWYNYFFAAVAAYLAPLLAVCVTRGHRLFMLADAGFFSDGAFWYGMLVPGGITFLVLLPFLKFDFVRLVVFAGLSIFWTWLLLANA